MAGRKRGQHKAPERGPLPVPRLTSIRIDPSRVEDWGVWPFNLPFVRNLDLRFDDRITYFLGEKSEDAV